MNALHPEIFGAQSSLRQRIALRLLNFFGWSLHIPIELPPKAVVVVYPHTSNWDFPIGVLARNAGGIEVGWIGKDNLFRGPFDRFFRWLGGVPVNRRVRTGLVEQLSTEFRRRDQLLLAITPEGTRSRTDYWKSGFYHVARAAPVPVALAFIDYPRREIGIGDCFELSGNMVADMTRIRAFYADKVGRRPALQGPVRFREEDETGGTV